MNFDDSLNPQQQPLTQDISLHHPYHQTLSHKLKSFKTDQIPYQFIHKHPQNLTNLDFNLQQTLDFNSYWLNGAPEKTDLQILKKNTRLLQNNKTLKQFSLTLKMYTSFDLNYILSHLKYLRNISTFHLNIANKEDLSSHKIKILSLIISNLKNLTTFSLQIPEHFHISFKLIDSLFSALKRLSSFSHLALKLNSRREFSDAHIKELALHLCSLPKLQSIKFTIENSKKLTSNALQPLSLAFKKLPLLSNVSIKFPTCSVLTFQELFSGLATLKLLKRLDLSIRPDSKSIESISPGLKILNTSSVREISLKLHQNLKDSDLIQLFQALAQFSALKVLNLDFPNVPVLSIQGVSQATSILKTFTSLSSLSLSSLGPAKLYQSIELISQGITPLNQLENLSLDFAGCFGQKSHSIKTLSSAFQNLKLLKKLNLNLDSCMFLDDEEIAFLTEGLETLKDLTSLVIDFSAISSLTNQGVSSVVSSLSNLKKLTHLTLRLTSNKIDGNALKIIAQGLQNLPALYSFDLTFFTYYHTSYDDGFKELCDNLQNLVSLREVCLEVKKTELSGEIIRPLEKFKSFTFKWFCIR